MNQIEPFSIQQYAALIGILNGFSAFTHFCALKMIFAYNHLHFTLKYCSTAAVCCSKTLTARHYNSHTNSVNVQAGV